MLRLTVIRLIRAPHWFCKHTVAALLVGVVLGTANSWAGTTLDEAERVTLYGDFRLRPESDWDSTNSDGTQRDDRHRLRIRARVAVDLKATENIVMTMRLRSGSDDSQQSPHITIIDFSGNDTGDGDFNLDRWLAKYKSKGSNIWTGRDSPTYWKQNEQSWSDDVTVAGIGGAWQASKGLTVNAGYYSLPVGMHNFSGNMALLQLVYRKDIGNNALTLSGGLLHIDADPDNRHGEKLLDGNGSRNYATWIGSVQYLMNLTKKPLALGIDYMHNSEDYDKDDEDAYTAHHHDQTNGYVLSAVMAVHPTQVTGCMVTITTTYRLLL